jgi:hypothetical protein
MARGKKKGPWARTRFRDEWEVAIGGSHTQVAVTKGGDANLVIFIVSADEPCAGDQRLDEAEQIVLQALNRGQ